MDKAPEGEVDSHSNCRFPRWKGVVPIAVCRWIHKQQAPMLQTNLHWVNMTYLATQVTVLQNKVTSLTEGQRSNGSTVVKILFIVPVLADVVRAISVSVDKNKIVAMTGKLRNQVPEVR